MKAVWFLVGGVAVVCWTEKLGTKRSGNETHVSSFGAFVSYRDMNWVLALVRAGLRRSCINRTKRKWYAQAFVRRGDSMNHFI